jgi:hypothetical protein
MFKKIILFIILLPLMVGAAMAASPDQAVVIAAQQRVSYFLEKIPLGQESQYGFKSRNEFRLVAIGQPYRMVKLNEDFYSAKKLTDKNYLSASDEWRVPVSVNGDDRILLTVIKSADSYQVVDMGGVKLAKELQQLKNAHPGNLKNYILRVYSTPMDFFVASASVETLNQGMVYPMALTKNQVKSFQRTQKQTFSMNETLSMIKEQIADHQ